MEKRFVQVFIKTEANLPKEEGNYLAFMRNPNEVTNIHIFPDNKDSRKRWMEDIDWYLQPQPEVTQEGKTADIDKFCERLDEIFDQGMPTKVQIIDAFKKSQSPVASDEDIEIWAAGKVNEIDPDEYGYGDLLIEGAKAMRDGKILTK